jgi:hypothetical protein
MATDNVGMHVHAENCIPDISATYSIRHVRDTVRIMSPDKKTVVLPDDSHAFIQTLSTFAPLGLATLRPDGQLAIVEAGSGRSVEFLAKELVHVAAVMSAFCVIEERQPIVELPLMEPTPLAEALFRETAVSEVGMPAWISGNPDFKRNLAIDEGEIVLDFAPLEMSKKVKNAVEGRASPETADAWGYEVHARGNHFGWVVLLDPHNVLVTGVGDTKCSKHRTVMSAMFRLSSHLQAMEEIA